MFELYIDTDDSGRSFCYPPPDASQLHTVYVMDDVQETINAWSVAVIIPFPGTVLKFPIGTSVPPAVEANYQSSLLAIETANATMSEGPNNGPNPVGAAGSG